MGAFAGCSAKLERANQHLDLLKYEIGLFRENQPYLTIGQFETPRQYVVRFRVMREPPIMWSVIVGEIAHNLRSALDYSAWQLVLINNNTPGRWTSFPIFIDRAAWLKDVAQRDPGRSPGPLEGVVKGWTEVEALQPFNAGDPREDPLAQLQWLSNTDKHRLVVAGFWCLPDVPLMMDREIIDRVAGPEFGTIRNPDERLQDGAPIFEMNFNDPQDPSDMDMDFSTPISIAFGERRPALTLDRLRLLYEKVANTVQAFESFVP